MRYRVKRKSTFEKWKAKNHSSRRYAHFDERVTLRTALGYVCDPKNVASHNFYPFIHFIITNPKYSTKTKKVKHKDRKIYYSAHMDRYVYSYYAYLINEHYNKRLEVDGADEALIGYRNNKHRISNITYAKRAFDFIKETENCHVIIGDFKNFFDELDHKYLKARLIDLIGSGTLSKDFYAVYKNITKFTYWKLESLFALNNIKVNMKNPNSIKKSYDILNKKKRFYALAISRIIKG